ncbi:MAG: 6-carboxytetrahydropterin synthase [Spirochaetales bacterium]|nr:MAG: 6-carboxytetrahydropterin synthase [Spirochaetales bacterium]
MHSLMVKKDFIASHFLIGGDWGNENKPHAHHYVLELILEGETLDHNNYLVDIVEVEAAMNELILGYKNRLLNDLEDFVGRNPSIELFSKILCTAMSGRIKDPRISALKAVLWENESAWAGYGIRRS